jgi:hypothetical protein
MPRKSFCGGVFNAYFCSAYIFPAVSNLRTFNLIFILGEEEEVPEG